MNQVLRRLFLTFIICLSACAIATAQDAPVPAAAPDFTPAIASAREVMQQMLQASGTPGASIAVAHDGRIIFEQGFGLASVELNAAATTDTRFGIGSITKSLTMALCARLADDGLLDLDAPIENYIPEFAHAGKGITIRLIASHLSGMGDEFTAARWSGDEHFATTADALQHIMQEPLVHAPGTQHLYATGSYTIIAAAIERVTGEEFRHAMQTRLLNPMRLNNTVPNDRRAVIPHRTAFYVRDDQGNGIINAPFFDPSHKWAGAGYLSTAGDTALFAQRMLDDKIISQAAQREIFTPVATTAGENTGFGLGWRIDDHNGAIAYHQPGGGPGISAWVILLPEKKLSMAILTNMTGAPVAGSQAISILDGFIETIDAAAKPE